MSSHARQLGRDFYSGGEPEPDPHFYQPPTSGTMGALPVLSWTQAGAQLTRGGDSWSTTLSTPITLTYGFRTSMPPGVQAEGGVSVFAAFNATQIAVTEEILRLWSDIANITFVRVGEGVSGPNAYSDNATILFGNFMNGPAQFSAFAYLPAPGATAGTDFNGDVWTNGSRDYLADPATFSRGASILVHEIGHALGLLHASNYGGGAQSGPTYQSDADYWQDTAMFTQMSYFNETHTGANFLGNAPRGPQMHDIAAAQRLYGANLTTRTGDTIYGFNSNADRSYLQIASAAQVAVFCIWDAGGNDTLDLSGYASTEHIDLREEAFSSAGGATYNISIARGTVVENAIGGSGNDTIIGNSANNTLTGNGGADTITGDAGDDLIDGGGAADTASFSTTRAANGVFAFGGVIGVVNTAASETDRLVNVETLQFSDQSLAAGSVAAFNGLDYIASHNDLITAFGANATSGFNHWIDNGYIEGRAMDAFDAYEYLAGYGDILASIGDNPAGAAQHFITTGFSGGRVRDNFDNLQYTAGYNDLIAAWGLNTAPTAQHLVQFGHNEGRIADNFDGLQYVAGYNDLLVAFGTNENASARHFIQYGFGEGRARDSFDGYQYVAGYDDLIISVGLDQHGAAQHFITTGFAGGRQRDSFDGLQYIASYGDLIAVFGVNESAGAQHYVQFGHTEGRARDSFDAEQYLDNYADLQAAFGDDLAAVTLHFIQYGYSEGRTDDAFV